MCFSRDARARLRGVDGYSAARQMMPSEDAESLSDSPRDQCRALRQEWLDSTAAKAQFELVAECPIRLDVARVSFPGGAFPGASFYAHAAQVAA